MQAIVSRSSTKASVAMATTPVQLTEAQEAAAREVFEVFDQRGTGSISASELSDVFDTLGQPLSTEDARELVRLNGSGEELNYDEFRQLLVVQLLAQEAKRGGTGVYATARRCDERAALRRAGRA